MHVLGLSNRSIAGFSEKRHVQSQNYETRVNKNKVELGLSNAICIGCFAQDITQLNYNITQIN